MLIDEDEYVAHYGTPRHSGRYPWGSGEDGQQAPENRTLLEEIDVLKKQGLTDTQIARGMGMSTGEFRARRTVAKNEKKQAEITRAHILRDRGLSHQAIADKMGVSGESYVRTLLAPGEKEKADITITVANMLRDQVAEKTYVDIGTGVENHLGISDTRLKTAVQILKDEGYVTHVLKVPQLGTKAGQKTNVNVLCPPGTSWGEVAKNQNKVQQIMMYTEDNGRSFLGIAPPLPINPKRVGIIYKEDGGDKADGVLYVRPGVKDVSLGNSRYAQVRVQVGDKQYIKGMAMYKDDLPPGIDIMFNTNKSKTEPPEKVFKDLTGDPDSPFGAVIRRQIGEKDELGRVTKAASVMNIVNEEGDWGKWSKSIAPQVLSKQDRSLARRQLEMTYETRKKNFDEIKALTNPVVRRKLLQEFSDGTDAAAVQLQAAGLPRMGWHAILPMNSIPPGQIYAPNYNDGERVALIRYPHGGRFEIPDLIVNNKHRDGRKLLGNAKDAVGIHSSVAERLSGADFDGDTVLVIPNNAGKIKIRPALDGLKDFEPRILYKEYPGMKVMRNTQAEMGNISNLITDMTIKKASGSEIARAVRHSMVVIDAEKHRLNYKQSEIDNNIKELKEKYQRQPDGSAGAATLVSRAKGRLYVPERELRKASQGGPIDPKTGRLVYVETGKIDNRTGLPKRDLIKRLAGTDDARTLSSGTPIENLYAEHSNRLKDLSNQARLELLNTPKLKRSPSAAKTYKSEVASLKAKLDLAIRNRPLERQAQLIANANLRAKKAQNPDMDKAVLRKVKYQALAEARKRTGAAAQNITFTQNEWDAIQAGAISDSMLSQLLNAADMDSVRAFATPPKQVLMTPAKTARAQDMLDSGKYTRAEIAKALGVSLTTLDTATG